MPGEWETHEATWLAWPHNRSDWPGKYSPIPWVYADIVRHLVRGERVHMIVNDQVWEDRARAVLLRAHVPLGQIEFHRWRTDRGWLRDSGAIIVRKGAQGHAALSWCFTAWAKYADWRHDTRIAERMARHLGLECLRPVAGRFRLSVSRYPLVPNRKMGSGEREIGNGKRITLEGGAIDVNGRGAMLATEECLLSPDVQVRNPGITRQQLEAVFQCYLGVSRVIWLERGIVGDDTHGHVDDIARFVSPNTVVAAVEQDPDDSNYELLQKNLARLRAATDQDGQPLRVVELPMPSPVWFRRRRLPASYANFYIANTAVLVPTFNDPNDRVALEILAGQFPDRKVVGIHCGDLIWGLGTIHCMTQQQPENSEVRRPKSE
jgi:agmatine deiminase